MDESSVQGTTHGVWHIYIRTLSLSGIIVVKDATSTGAAAAAAVSPYHRQDVYIQPTLLLCTYIVFLLCVTKAVALPGSAK